MSELREKQQRFSQMVAVLIRYAWAKGYLVTFGHATRCQNCPIGHANSLHKQRLAIDLNLFRKDRPDVLLTQTEDHRTLGEFWETIGGTWGGRFGDGNHYSIKHLGMK